MSFVPPQGFRHAATLLLTNGVRSIPADAKEESTSAALEHLAHELIGLATDTRASAEAASWLISEFSALIDRMPQKFDRSSAKSLAASILAGPGRQAQVPSNACDLFLIYVPEDRLAVAAPLAIELVKRRVSVAFAEYEVATEPQLAAAVERGLQLHNVGVLLVTDGFKRFNWPLPDSSRNERFTILTDPPAPQTADHLASWARRGRMSKS